MGDLTIGQRAADFASRHIGSWAFLILFNGAMAVYMGANWLMGEAAFDPFPFIFLNLMLSWLAGVQAPLIMISQNRQEELQSRTIEDIAQIGRATLEIASGTKQLLIEQMDLLEEMEREQDCA